MQKIDRLEGEMGLCGEAIDAAQGKVDVVPNTVRPLDLGPKGCRALCDAITTPIPSDSTSLIYLALPADGQETPRALPQLNGGATS